MISTIKVNILALKYVLNKYLNYKRLFPNYKYIYLPKKCNFYRIVQLSTKKSQKTFNKLLVFGYHHIIDIKLHNCDTLEQS